MSPTEALDLYLQAIARHPLVYALYQSAREGHTPARSAFHRAVARTPELRAARAEWRRVLRAAWGLDALAEQEAA